MRVRMLKTHETPATDAKLGALTLRYPAGSTQHFDAATAAALIARGIAEEQPEDGGRVTMLRTITAPDGTRMAKGHVWHVGGAQLAQLLDATNAAGDPDPAAKLTPDPDADFIGATAAAALDDAKARAVEQTAADAKRAEIKARMTAASSASSASSSSSASSAKKAAPAAAATSTSTEA